MNRQKRALDNKLKRNSFCLDPKCVSKNVHSFRSIIIILVIKRDGM